MPWLISPEYCEKSLLFSVVAETFFRITEDKEVAHQLLDNNKGKSKVWLVYAPEERLEETAWKGLN